MKLNCDKLQRAGRKARIPIYRFGRGCISSKVCYLITNWPWLGQSPFSLASNSNLASSRSFTTFASSVTLVSLGLGPQLHRKGNFREICWPPPLNGLAGLFNVPSTLAAPVATDFGPVSDAPHFFFQYIVVVALVTRMLLLFH